MKSTITQSMLFSAALLVTAGLCLAVESKPGTAAETKAISAPKSTAKTAKSKDAKTAAKVKPVDINGAGKKELMTLPGVGDAEAEKIIAGRPYLVKAHLVTHGVLPRAVYENLKGLVLAKQKPEYLEKAGKK